jgi:DNA-binding SARP family transcriptional activator
VEFRILGPVEVVDDSGSVVAVGGSRERTLLGLLVLSANKVLSTERLLEELWGDSHPEGALHALRVYLSRLRKALREAGAGRALITRAPGYFLQVEPKAVDAVRFEALLAAGRTHAARGEPAEAARTLREALSLWRDRPLVDAMDTPLTRTEAERLEEARLTALEERIEADLACGRHRELVPELDALTRAHPLRERLWGQRMLALYRAHRQAEALRAYQTLRGMLLDELGLEPSAALAALERAILHQAAEIEWRTHEPEAAELPLPPEFSIDGARPFVSRDAELHSAEGFLADSDRRRLGVVWLFGEPGIGKTRLATEIARRFHSAGGLVLFGRCNEDLAVPFQPFLEALRWHVLHLPAAELPYRLGEAPAELIRFVPELAERLPAVASSSPAIEQYRLFEAVRTWLAGADGDRPVLAVLDDVHWASPPTLALLRHVARSPERSRALLVCTARNTAPDEDKAVAALAEELARRETPTLRLELGGLTVDEIGQLIESSIDSALNVQTVAEKLLQETAGNPLFVQALVDAFDAGEVPRSLTETVLQRVDRLPPEVVGVLRVAAVAGLEFDLRVVARAAGRPELLVAEALETAGRAGLVQEASVDRYRFNHALVRSALRQDLSESRRVRLHLGIGEAMEALYGAAEEHADALAFHFAEAVPVDGAERAYRYTVLAAERATRLLAHREAADAYRRALKLLDAMEGTGPLARYDLLFSLGTAERRAGDLIGALATLRAAAEESRGAPTEFARAAVAYEEASLWLGLPGSDALPLLEEAEKELGHKKSILRALTLASLSRALAHAGRRVESREKASNALVLAEQLGDAGAQLAVLTRTTMPKVDVADALVAADGTREITRRAQALGDDESALMGMYGTLWANLQLGDLTAFDDLLPHYWRLASQLRQPMWEHNANLLGSIRAFLAADLESAETLLQGAEQAMELLGWGREGLYGVAMFLIRREQGRLTGLGPAVRVLARSESSAALWGPGLAALYAQEGMLDDARAEFERFAKNGFASVPGTGDRELCLAFLAEVCITLGDTSRAPQLIGYLSPCSGRLLVFHGSAACLGPTDRLLGMLASTAGWPDEADRWHRHGLGLARRTGSPLWIAHCLHDYAVSLGATARATGMLAEAAALTQRHGLVALSERVGRRLNR